MWFVWQNVVVTHTIYSKCSNRTCLFQELKSSLCSIQKFVVTSMCKTWVWADSSVNFSLLRVWGRGIQYNSTILSTHTQNTHIIYNILNTTTSVYSDLWTSKYDMNMTPQLRFQNKLCIFFWGCNSKGLWWNLNRTSIHPI